MKQVYDHKSTDMLPYKEFMKMAKESSSGQCRDNPVTETDRHDVNDSYNPATSSAARE